MSKFIHKFETGIERSEATYSEPWVSYTEDLDALEYNKIMLEIRRIGTFDYGTTDVVPIKTIQLTQVKGIHVYVSVETLQ